MKKNNFEATYTLTIDFKPVPKLEEKLQLSDEKEKT